MKHKLKKILLLYLLSGTLFVSCSLEEEYLKQDNANLKIKIERKTFHELMKEEKFNAAYTKISKQKNPISSSVLGRTVMEAEYDFTISNIPAKVITYGNNISYSFHINRNASNSNYFENLVVKVDSTTIPKAYIIKYVLNSNPIFISEHNAYTLDAQTEITQINYNDAEAKIEYYDGCAVVTLWCPYDGPHPATEICIKQDRGDLYWVRDTSGCGDGLDSGGGGSSGPIDTTGGGGGTGGTTGEVDTPHNDSGNNNPIVTAPVLELEEEEAPKKTPCEELKKLINYIESKDAISNLEEHLLEDKEYGFAYEALPNSSDLDEIHPIVSLPDEPLKLQMGNYIGGNFIGAYHIHPRPSTSDAVPMFAADDVAWLFKVAKSHLPEIPLNQKDFSIYFLTLTVGSGTYAIKIKDGPKFYAFMMRAYYREFKEELQRKYTELGVMASASTLKREFLKILNKNINSGIGLYQLNEDKTDWEELVFNPLYPNSDPVKKPCNTKKI